MLTLTLSLLVGISVSLTGPHEVPNLAKIWQRVSRGSPIAYLYNWDWTKSVGTITFLGKQGQMLGKVKSVNRIYSLELSPSGKYAACLMDEPNSDHLALSVLDRAGHFRTTFVEVGGTNFLWTAQDSLILYSSNDGGWNGSVPSSLTIGDKQLSLRVCRYPVTRLVRTVLKGKRALLGYFRPVNLNYGPSTSNDRDTSHFWADQQLEKVAESFSWPQFSLLDLLPSGDGSLVAMKLQNSNSAVLRTSDSSFLWKRAYRGTPLLAWAPEGRWLASIVPDAENRGSQIEVIGSNGRTLHHWHPAIFVPLP